MFCINKKPTESFSKALPKALSNVLFTLVVSTILTNYLPLFQKEAILISLIQSCKNVHLAEKRLNDNSFRIGALELLA